MGRESRLRALTGNLDGEGGESFSNGSDVSRVIQDYQMELREKLSPEQGQKQGGQDLYGGEAGFARLM